MKEKIMNKIKLIEAQVTWQGEGVDSGKRMLLCRFKYCNKSCPWCDTKVKMRISTEAEYSLETLQDIMDKEKAGIMITGGEPTFGGHLNATVLMLNNLRYQVANVETNGCDLVELIKRVDSTKNVSYIYSPKLFDYKDVTEAAKVSALIINNQKVFFKIVVEDNNFVKNFLNSLATALDNVSAFGHGRVFLMPEGITRDALIKNSGIVYDLAEQYKFNISSREHIIFGFI
jgi:organic radical activating enzyme